MNALKKLSSVKWLLFLFLTFCILSYNYNSIKLDGVHGFFLKMLIPHSTIYAENYTDKEFISVKVGDSDTLVKSKLGKPLSTYKVQGNLVGMRWSEPENDCSYCVRVILFRDGFVVRKNSEFYPD